MVGLMLTLGRCGDVWVGGVSAVFMEMGVICGCGELFWKGDEDAFIEGSE